MSTLSPRHRYLTPDDLLRMPKGKSCELIDGRLVRKKMGALSQYVCDQITEILAAHCRPTGVAHVFVESGYVCFPSKTNRMRRPDVSCVLAERLPFEKIVDGHLNIHPDLAVEVISPRDRVVELEDKLRDYRDAGIPLVWLVFLSTKSVRVIRLEGPPSDFGSEDELTGESILPGFRCRVGDLFEPHRA